ncbi:YfhO family protein [Aliifodinibius sp. S!AR15-10]|uniref:YfhO family protein n=1 Tax=Aliifodinibius sp. S!AR15-10 TaxID=2950437 RepID=UPI0028566506|nr:YfhO family protein [Aliifodinibius sp. S!AR15-10]MDR8394063.1 YfhO family protein [Aliifodinibius sp. S!AR15-10]
MSSRNRSNSYKTDFISSLSLRKKHLLALFIILVLPFMLFDEASFGGKQFMGDDTIQWRAGAESIFDYREANDGEEALWATNMFSGMPAYTVSVQKTVPHLDNLVRNLFESIYPVAHFWILLAGVYVLLFLMGMRPLTSLIGAICIGFTTYLPIILGAGHNSKFIAFVFIPWMFVGYWLLTRSDKKLLSFALFAIALTLEFRAGHPQVTYYFFYLLGFWWLFDTWQAYQRNEISSWLRTTGLIVFAGILGFAGNAQQYWRLLEYSPYSIRGGSSLAEGGGGLGLDYAFRWSQGVGELLTLIIPGIFGGGSGEAYWGPKPGTSGPHYLGAIAFIFALVGLLRSKQKIKYMFFGVGTLTLLFSLGHHFDSFNRIFFNYVPYFNKFRTPEMWLIVTVFCYTIVAVFGLEYLFELAKEKSKKLEPLFIPFGVALGLGLIFALGSNALLSFEKPGERQQYAQQVAQNNNVQPSSPQVQQAVDNFMNTQLKPQRKEMAKNDSIRFFIIVLLVSGLVFAFVQQKLGAGFFLLGLVVIASYDYISVGDRYTNEDRMVSEMVDPERVIQQQAREIDKFLQSNVESGDGWPYRVFPLTDNPFNNAVPSYFYPSIGGYSGAKLSYYQDLIDNLLFTGQGSLNMPILNMLNVKYITYPQQLPFENLTQVYSGNDGYVFENQSVLPKAFYVDSVRTVSSPSEAIEALQQAFDPTNTAIVEGYPSVDIQADTAASLQITHYDARNIEMTTNRSTPGYLVLSEIYYPKGWELTIDGEPAEIYKTNYVLRGMNVPAGKHTLRMEFNPVSYIWGGRIAWASNILQWSIGLFALVMWYRRKDEDQVVEEQNE